MGVHCRLRSLFAGPPKVACSVRGTSPPKIVLSARGTKSTQSSAFGAGHESTHSSDFGTGHEPTQTDPWDRRGGSAQPAGPYEIDTVMSNRVGACQSHGVEACLDTAVVLRSRLWQAGQTNRRCRWRCLCGTRGCNRTVTNLSYRWTRALRVATLPMLSCALCRKKCGTLFPTGSPDVFESPNNAADPQI